LDRSNQKSFRLLKKIKDPNFDIDRLEYYSLSLYMGEKDFQMLITDLETSYVVLLEDYVFEPGLDDSAKKAAIKYIFDDHHLLLANFWRSINLIIKNRNYSFVPYALFDAGKASSYLSINTSFDADTDELMLTYHKFLDLVNVFSVPLWIVELLNSIYQGNQISYIHQSSSLIDGVYAQNTAGRKDIAMYLDRFGMHIVVIDDQRLIFYNQYLIKKFVDYANFIRMVSREIDFDLDNDEIKIYGYLGQNTPHFQELKKSIPQLSFGGRPKNVKFGFVFDELMEHQYFDLFATQSSRH
jgi:hypothetical protein